MKRFLVATSGLLLLWGLACGSSSNGKKTTTDNGGPGGAVCGNSVCESGETPQNCPSDCKGTCGNGTCDQGETAQTCPADCGNNNGGPKCGNGACEQGETPQNCPSDCQNDVTIDNNNPPDTNPGAVCGNGKCEQGETHQNCPSDCQQQSVCGNGACEQGETPQNCPSDCQGDVTNDNGNDTTGGPVCGNGKCEDGETAANCPADCSAQKMDCKGYAKCWGDCNSNHSGDASCVTNCQNQSTTQAVQNFSDFQGCLSQNCKNASTNDELNKCLEAHCLDQYFKCFSGTKYQKCTDLVNCLNNCPKDDPSTPKVNEQQQCLGNCWSDSTYDTEWDLQHLIDCANGLCKNECQDPKSDACNQCFNNAFFDQQCIQYTKKCFPNGNNTCGQTLDCLGTCQQGDKQCVQNCLNKGTLEAQKQFSDWQQCAVNACKSQCADTSSQQCNDCWNQVLGNGGSCHDKYQACAEDIPNGDQHCKESWNCMAGATTNDEYLQCKYKATKDAQQQIEKIQQCIAQNCKNDCADTSSSQGKQKCQTCLKNVQDPNNGACKDPINQCLSDSNPS